LSFQICYICAELNYAMNYKLQDIAEIFTGYTFRNAIVHEPDGDIAIIQLKDLSADYQQIESFNTFCLPFSSYQKHLLQPNDIIFVSKGLNNFAIQFIQTYQKAIATATFIIIRPKNNQICSEYLTWYINQPAAQEQLHSGKEHRSTVFSITIKTLAELSIEVPSLDKQRIIGKIATLNYQQKTLSIQLAEKRKTLLDNLLTKKI